MKAFGRRKKHSLLCTNQQKGRKKLLIYTIISFGLPLAFTFGIYFMDLFQIGRIELGKEVKKEDEILQMSHSVYWTKNTDEEIYKLKISQSFKKDFSLKLKGS